MQKDRFLQSGFTIIELLVSMAIIAIIMPLGTSAFIETRNSRTVSESANAVRDVIKNARAISLSVASTSEDWPVAYEAVFDTDSIKTYALYAEDFSDGFSEWNPNDDYRKELLNEELLTNTKVDLSQCDRVLFSSVNGRMYIYNGTYSKLVSDNCVVNMSVGSKELNLVLNSKQKRFEIVSDVGAIEVISDYEDVTGDFVYEKDITETDDLLKEDTTKINTNPDITKL